MSLSEHLTSCGMWTGHGCTCWLLRHPEVAEDPKDARIAVLKARIEELQRVVAPLTTLEAEAVKALGPLLEAGDALHRAEQAEATIERQREDLATVDVQLGDERLKGRRLEAALEERDRMLRLAWEEHTDPSNDGYDAWLADFRARAEEESEK